nr:uncharacterized mitochondrial protein AtMg00810-like [Tanacetum cinerariifolium]
MVDMLPLVEIQRAVRSLMCDKKNSVLFTDTGCLVLSPEFKLLDGTQVLLRVPRENNMYNVDLKNIVPSGDLTCLFAKAILDESNLWHRRLGHIHFKTMNKLVKDFLGKFDGKVDEGFLVRYSYRSSGSTNPHKSDRDAAFDEKEPEFEGRKLESEVNVSPSSSAQTKKHDDKTKREAKGKSHVESVTGYRNLSTEFKDFSNNNINEVNAAGNSVLTVGQIFTDSTNTFSAAGPSNAAVSPTHVKSSYVDSSQLPADLNMPELEDITYSDDEEDVGAEADFTNLEITITVTTQTRSMIRVAKDQGGLSQINNDDFHTCMFAYFLLQEEPKRIYQALKDPSWIEAMQEELLQFKKQKVWVLVDLPNGKRAIGFEDPNYPDKVYKVVKALYGLHQAPRAWYDTLANYLLENGFQRGKIDQTLFRKRQQAFEKLMKDKFQMSSMGELTFFLGLQVKQNKDGIFISQDKYVAEILRKFSLTDRKSASTPIDTEKPLLKDPDGEDVDVHTCRSMIGSLMYLTSSRPNIMFVVCACARFQVTPKVKRIFRYLKGKPFLGLWYPKDLPFNLVAYSDSNYAAILRLVKVNNITRFQALVDKKKMIITEDTIRDSFHLDNAEGVECLPYEDIFADLARMRVGKGFSRVDTPLFEEMIVAQEGRMIANMDADFDVTLKEIAKDVALNADVEEKPAELQEVVEVVTTAKLIIEVVTAASATITVVASQLTTVAAPTLTTAPSAAKRRNGVVIRNPKETTTPSTIIHSEAKSKDKGKGILVEEPKPLKKKTQIEQDKAYARELEAELNKNIDWDEVIDHVHKKQKEDNPVKRYQALKRKPQTKAHAKKNMMIYPRNVVGFKMDYFKGMTYDDIRLIFEKKFNSNMAFLLKTKEQLDEEESRALKC